MSGEKRLWTYKQLKYIKIKEKNRLRRKEGQRGTRRKGQKQRQTDREKGEREKLERCFFLEE